MHWKSCWRWWRSNHIPKDSDTETRTKNNSQKHVASAAAAQRAAAPPQSSESGSSLGKPRRLGGQTEINVTSDSSSNGKPLRVERGVIQIPDIDLRVDGMPQEDVYSDEQYMDEVKRQVEKIQDESKSPSMHKDLQGSILSEETSPKIKHMGNIELHEIRQRKATVLCPQCSAHLADWFQFCTCGASLEMDDTAVSRIR